MTESPGVLEQSSLSQAQQQQSPSTSSFEPISNTNSTISSFSGSPNFSDEDNMEDKSSSSTTSIEQNFQDLNSTNNSNNNSDNNNINNNNSDNNSQDKVATDNIEQQNNNDNNTTTEVSMQESQLPELTKTEIHEIIIDVRGKRLQVGEMWALINYDWWVRWQEYTPRDELGKIDNSTFLINNTPEHLRPGVSEGRDFALIPDSVFNRIQQVYGGGPAVIRKVIKGPIGNTIVDLRVPFPLKVLKSSAPSEVSDCFAFKSETIKLFKERACKLLNVEPINIRIWDYYNNNKHAELKDNEYVSNSNLLDNQLILLDERLPNGKWPEQSDNRYQSFSMNTRDGEKRPGITGLGNLGNTCFMNSALQCLSNTYPLTKYFFSGKYENDINRDNPLGCGGELATEYASLISEIWEGNRTSIYPRPFKSQIERFAPQFAGYHQHDSQELLAFLLDGLHEDLNKVKKKPFFEGKDYDGRPDKVIAEEQWGMHTARNNSVIVDWFQAQLKSKLVCPDCGKISITFDPFMYLSLPLPSEINKQFNYCFVNNELQVEKRQLQLSSNTCQVKDFLNKLGEEVGVSPSHLIFSMNGKLMNPEYNLGERMYYGGGSREIVVYQLDSAPDNGNLVLFKSHTPNSSYLLLHIPLYFIVPSQIQSPLELYEFIIQKLTPHLKDINGIKEILESNSISITKQNGEQNDQELQQQQQDSMVGTSAESSVDNNNSNSNNNSTSSNNITTTSTTSTNGHHYGSSENNYSSSSSSSYHYNRHHDDRDEPQKDPRFIFQMYDASTYHKQKVNFPIETKEISLVWEDPVQYFDVEKINPDIAKQGGIRDVSPYNVNLEQCINLFTTEEQLGPEDPWYCSDCKKHQRAHKKFDIWSAPPILVVHLKRFSYRKHYRDKLDTLVRFPITDLDLTDYVLSKDQPPPIYDLFAVSNHYGSLGGGHYTAYALNEPEAKWYKFDDSHVSEANVNNVESEAAYVLFYRRKDTYDANFDLNKHLDDTIINNNENQPDNNNSTTTTTTTTTTSSNNDNMNLDNNSSTNTLD